MNLKYYLNRRHTTLRSISIFIGIALSGCATGIKREIYEKDHLDLLNQLNTLQSKITQLHQKVDLQDSKIQSLGEKVELIKSKDSIHPKNSVGTQPHPAEAIGADLDPIIAESDPEAGFTLDQPVLAYRKSTVFFKAKQFSEAVLSFSAFMERFPDHALAGSAQFFLAESYRNKGETQNAIREYERVLVSYNRSPYITESLKHLSQLEQSLGKTEKAKSYKQRLISQFPLSPAAKSTENTPAALPSPVGAASGEPAREELPPAELSKSPQESKEAKE